VRRLIITAALALVAGGTIAAAQDRPVVDVYTYSSFTSEWGPGPKIGAAFEQGCGCTLRWTSVDDAVMLLSRLRLEGERTPADIVLGLDNNLLEEGRALGLLAPHGIELGPLDLPLAWEDDTYVPFDWGWFAFVYDATRLANPPDSFEALIGAAPEVKILIQDPRTSTPGLGLLLWVKAAYGDRAGEIWKGLAPRIVTVTQGWSEAYGMFLEGEAPLVLSYTTSPAYHRHAEQKDTIRAAAFAEGHYLQVEVAAKLRTTDQPELADRFLRFVLSDAFQREIPTTNWMYPARMPAVGLPEAYAGLVRPATTLMLPAGQVAAERDRWIAEWREALGG
jgi:thiamine transport system substrate-binding protein